MYHYCVVHVKCTSRTPNCVPYCTSKIFHLRGDIRRPLKGKGERERRRRRRNEFSTWLHVTTMMGRELAPRENVDFCVRTTLIFAGKGR